MCRFSIRLLASAVVSGSPALSSNSSSHVASSASVSSVRPWCDATIRSRLSCWPVMIVAGAVSGRGQGELPAPVLIPGDLVVVPRGGEDVHVAIAVHTRHLDRASTGGVGNHGLGPTGHLPIGCRPARRQEQNQGQGTKQTRHKIKGRVVFRMGYSYFVRY